MPPPNLAARLQRLPPILHSQSLVSLSSCSKGSRGLSVLLRVNCIGTAISISLSPSPRQCGSRYSIRAGRNLPDKEFRYLRTVIVTAAVYWGCVSRFRFAAAAAHEPSSAGQDADHIRHLIVFEDSCVFDNRRLPPFLCNPPRLRLYNYT